MTQITIDVPEEINKKIEHYKIDHNLNDKRDATIKALKEFFKLK